MRHKMNNRCSPVLTWRALAWALISAITIVTPLASHARDPMQVRDAAAVQVRESPQALNAPQSGASSTIGPAVRIPREILGAGDSIRITVFQNPDLTIDTRVSQSGSIVYPLIGDVEVGGLTPAEAGTRIADQLRRGKFIVNPQVSIAIVQVRSRQVHVLGQVVRPGTYVLEDSETRLTDVLTLAGGISPSGVDTVTVLMNRGGKPEKREINIPAIFRGGDPSTNIIIENGDTLYVERAPVFYIYGEVQHAGAYRLEPNVIVMQALSLGGGLTARASERGIGIHRRLPDGEFVILDAKLTDRIQPEDIVYVRESMMDYRLRKQE